MTWMGIVAKILELMIYGLYTTNGSNHRTTDKKIPIYAMQYFFQSTA
jgi:hypothetical protein